MKTTDRIGLVECSVMTTDVDEFGFFGWMNHLTFGYWDQHRGKWRTQRFQLTESGRAKFMAFARSLLEDAAMATKASEK